jgi:SAM-dependent methyltransferase
VERGEYERLAAVEERMWWFRGLHANLVAALGEEGAPGRVLDAGCGTGGLLVQIADAFPTAERVGLELDHGAALLARAKGGGKLCVGSVDRLPFAEGVFDAVVSADVLCHHGVDERQALASFHRCLAPGGLLVLNLPAYRWLYSAHDAAVANARRYESGEVRRLVAEAGFARVRTHYWNSLLFPLMALRRALRRGRDAASEVALAPAPLEWTFGAALALERQLQRAGLWLPFGGSILATAVKP